MTYYKRLATKIVADWKLEVVVSRTEPVRVAFDWREQRMQTVSPSSSRSFINMVFSKIIKYFRSNWQVRLQDMTDELN